MNQLHSTTIQHQKGKHLTKDERILIQIRLNDGWSKRAIARELGCSPQTVCNEVKRGTVNLYHGKVKRYKANHGQEVYETNRSNCGRKFQFLDKCHFLSFVEDKFFNEGWSLDACVGYSLKNNLFNSDDMVCTSTLYNYVDIGLLNIKNHHLPEKLSRKPKHKRIRKNKKILGRSIDDRPEYINNREEFGHWELDLVIGRKSGEDNVLMTMVERKSREFLIMPLADKKSATVMKALDDLFSNYSEHISDVFKTITTDNGSEFADLSEIEELTKTLVYYAHPYTSCEKGSVERHNRLIRRFIPKGKRIDDYTADQIANIETWCNQLPRKILGYKTPDEIFESELDIIYQQRIS